MNISSRRRQARPAWRGPTPPPRPRLRCPVALSRPRAEPDDFGILLGLAYQRFVDALNRHLREHGFADLGSSFGYVLRALAAQPLTATQLASRLHLTRRAPPASWTTWCSAATSSGSSTPRRRARQLVLAPPGRQALRTARAFHAGFERDLADAWETERAAALHAALETLAAPADGDGPDTSSRLLRPL